MAHDPFSEQRARMVDDLDRRGIDDARVLDAMAAVPRERFVGRARRHEAYDDHPLPIHGGQTISQPYIVAVTLQAMAPGPGDRVLDVGTGSGYVAALLAELAGEVWSIERHPALAARARDLLRELSPGVHVIEGDGSLGWPDGAPYDAIGVAAAAPDVPAALIEQLVDGGRLVLPVGPADGHQELVRLVRGRQSVTQQPLGGVRFVPLIGADANPA